MAFTQITGIAPNYRDYKNWWLKAYKPGTTTPKLMSDNDTGSPTSAKYELNKDGFITSSGGALIIPHIDGDYDLWLFPTAAEADANDTTNAERLADDLENYLTNTSLGNSIGGFVSYEFDTVANAKIGLTIGGQTVTLKVTDVIRIKERGSALFDVIAGTGTANGIDIIAHSTLNVSFSLRVDTYVNAVQFGVSSGAGFDAEYQRMFDRALSEGVGVAYIPFDTVTLSVDVNCNGLNVIGSQTTLTGTTTRFINHAGIESFKLNNRDTNFKATHPALPLNNVNVALQRINANEYSVFVQKSTKGYLLMSFRNNVTTPDQSLATGTNDITSFRNVSAVNCVDCIVGFQGDGATTGTWSTANLITDIEEAFTGGIEYVYEWASGAVSKEYTVEVGLDGKFTVGFLRSGSSSTDAYVEVDGVSIESGINLTQGATKVEFREYTTLPGTRLIKVGALSGRLNVLGINVSKLKSFKNDTVIDTIGYYTNTTNYENYLSSTSANDYAILEKNSNLFGGSFHGGETSINTKFISNGNEITLSNGEVFAGNSLQIAQNFSIDWVSNGGPLLAVNTLTTFIRSGYVLQQAFTNEIETLSFFATLVGINTPFSQLEYPQRFDLTTLSSGERAFLGQQGQVVYKNPANDQRVRITNSTFNDYENEKGGSYVWKVDGLYNKYYSGLIDRGDRTITDLAVTNILEFL